MEWNIFSGQCAENENDLNNLCCPEGQVNDYGECADNCGENKVWTGQDHFLVPIKVELNVVAAEIQWMFIPKWTPSKDFLKSSKVLWERTGKNWSFLESQINFWGLLTTNF